jgi:hypothetical protein
MKNILKKLLKRSPEKNLENWFYSWLNAQNTDWRKLCSPQNCYFEFGVGWGRTMSAFARAAKRYCQDHKADIKEISIVGFDSFQGLPEKASPADDHIAWQTGSFSNSKEITLKQLEKIGFPLENVMLIEGFFHESLNADTFQKIAHLSPSIITLDVDYYSSTQQALDFIAPLLKSGAVFYFDDLWSFHGHPEMGQLKALREFHGKKGYLTPCRFFDHNASTYLFSSLEWEYGTKFDIP